MQLSFGDLDRAANGLLHVRAVNHRARDESASALGQWIHECLPRDFDTMDLDIVVRAQETGILRIIERKKPGQQLKGSQARILPVLARAIAAMESRGEVTPGSGVFVVWCTDEAIADAIRAHRSDIPMDIKQLNPIGNGPFAPVSIVPIAIVDVETWLRCRA